VAGGATGAGKQVLMVVDKTPQGIRQTVMDGVFFVPLKSGIA
jgi:protein-L-isoaspartate(D-aspartate) O-methyltransferase